MYTRIRQAFESLQTVPNQRTVEPGNTKTWIISHSKANTEINLIPTTKKTKAQRQRNYWNWSFHRDGGRFKSTLSSFFFSSPSFSARRRRTMSTKSADSLEYIEMTLQMLPLISRVRETFLTRLSWIRDCWFSLTCWISNRFWSKTDWTWSKLLLRVSQTSASQPSSSSSSSLSSREWRCVLSLGPSPMLVRPWGKPED